MRRLRRALKNTDENANKCTCGDGDCIDFDIVSGRGRDEHLPRILQPVDVFRFSSLRARRERPRRVSGGGGGLFVKYPYV